jgi:hypothetical protein
MRLTVALAVVLCSSAALADIGPPLPDDSLCRTDQRFEVAVKGVTGAKIDLRAEVGLECACSVCTADAKGTPMRVDIRIRDDEKGKKRVEISVVEKPANGPGRVVSLDTLLAPGQSTITGPGWNNLFEIRLSEVRGKAGWR